MKKPSIIILLTFNILITYSQNIVTNQVFINTSNPSVTQQSINYTNINEGNNIQSQSARNSFGNFRGNQFNNSNPQTKNNNKIKPTNKPKANTHINNIDINDNVNDNEVIQSNPVQVKTVKEVKTTVAPIGLDFKPSGLSGRDYSDGGKLKKGEKNFYSQSTHKTSSKKIKRKPSTHKRSYITHSCAKWKV